MDGAFNQCQNINEIKSKINNVGSVEIGENIFYSQVPYRALLYVPVGTAGAYRQTAPWSDFTNISEVFYKSDTLGDLNCDDVVNGTDVNFLVNQLLKKDVYEDVDGATDLNGDGRISGLDLNRMISIILGQ